MLSDDEGVVGVVVDELVLQGMVCELYTGGPCSAAVTELRSLDFERGFRLDFEPNKLNSRDDELLGTPRLLLDSLSSTLWRVSIEDETGCELPALGVTAVAAGTITADLVFRRELGLRVILLNLRRK